MPSSCVLRALSGQAHFCKNVGCRSRVEIIGGVFILTLCIVHTQGIVTAYCGGQGKMVVVLRRTPNRVCIKCLLLDGMLLMLLTSKGLRVVGAYLIPRPVPSGGAHQTRVALFPIHTPSFGWRSRVLSTSVVRPRWQDQCLPGL